MSAKEKATEHLKNNLTPYKEGFNTGIHIGEALDIAIQEAKKEVFDDIEKAIPRGISPYWDRIQELKHHHLKRG